MEAAVERTHRVTPLIAVAAMHHQCAYLGRCERRFCLVRPAPRKRVNLRGASSAPAVHAFKETILRLAIIGAKGLHRAAAGGLRPGYGRSTGRPSATQPTAPSEPSAYSST